MKAHLYYHRLSVTSTALWVIFSQCKDCPDNGYAKSDHLDINVVFSSDKLTGKVYSIISLGERIPFIKELTLLTENVLIHDLICALKKKIL